MPHQLQDARSRAPGGTRVRFNAPGGRRCCILDRLLAHSLSEGCVIAGLRERKRAANRAATVDAAYALFAERGYDEVTVADICAAADIAPRTFFRYFAGKEDIVIEPFRRLADQILEAISASPSSHSDADALLGALRMVGNAAIAERERLSAFLAVLRGAGHSSMARYQPLGAQERDIAQTLTKRHPSRAEPDWRLRLLAATSLAAFRVWFEDLTGAELADPRGHLDEILAAVGVPLAAGDPNIGDSGGQQ